MDVNDLSKKGYILFMRSGGSQIESASIEVIVGRRFRLSVRSTLSACGEGLHCHLALFILSPVAHRQLLLELETRCSVQ